MTNLIQPLINETGKALVVLSELSGEDYINEKLLSGKDGDLILKLFMDAGLRSKDFSFAVADHHEYSLKQVVDILKPLYIIAMGNEALKALTKKSGMKKHRGATIMLHPSFNYECPVYPIYSIEDLKNVPTFRRTMVADLRNTQQSETDTIEFEFWSKGEELRKEFPTSGNIKLVS